MASGKRTAPQYGAPVERAAAIAVPAPVNRSYRPLLQLTDVETAILTQLADGIKRESIAVRLGVSASSISQRVSIICGKLDSYTATQAAARAVKLGLISPTMDAR